MGLDLRLMKQVTNDIGKNEAISPFLITKVMSQIWLATNGTTRDEVRYRGFLIGLSAI